MFPPGDDHQRTSSSDVHRRHYSAPHMVASPSRRRPPTGEWDHRFTSTMNRTRSNSSSGGEVRRLSIMDYSSEGDGGGGNGGGGRAARRESFTGESADMDFLHRQQEDNLIPLKEDLADWLNKLLGIEIGVDDFMDVLDSGVHVCKLAKLITSNAEEAVKDGRVDERLPKTRLRFKENARSGTWFARDNVANFIKWCRDYGVKEECLFETEGLVSHTTPRNFVLCLLELGRMAYKYNMEAPCLVAMEKEIDRLEQGSSYGDVWSPEPEVFDSSARESRIPVRKSSTSSTVSNETHRSVSPSTRRSCSSRSTSPRPSSRSPSGRSPNGMSQSGRSPSRSPNSRHRVTSVTDSSVMTMRDSPKTLHTASIGTSSGDWADGGQDAGTSMGPRSSTVSVGTSSFLKVHSTGTGMDNDLNGFSSRGTSSNGTQAAVDGRRRSSRSPSPGRGVSNGTMTSGVDTRVNAGSNTDSPRSGSVSTSTSPDTPRRSVWRRSVSPHSTRIPVPVGTTAHGTLSQGVSSGSLNSVGTGTPTSRRRSSISSTSGDTPNVMRRRSSISSTSADTPNAIRRRSSISSTSADTPNAIRRRSSISSASSDTPNAMRQRSSIATPNGNTPNAVRRRSSIASTNGDTPKSTRRKSSIASTSNGDTPNSSRRLSSLVSTNGDTPNMVRRRSSMVSNSDTPRPGSGTKTPRRRSMSTRSDKSDELDKEVRRISGKCECPQCYQIDRLSEGKYKIGDRVVFVRLLKGKHVMVRVGGGWDTLDHYLTTHDPCRVMEVRREPSCHSLTADDDKFLFIHGKYKGHAAL